MRGKVLVGGRSTPRCAKCARVCAGHGCARGRERARGCAWTWLCLHAQMSAVHPSLAPACVCVCVCARARARAR